jgi:LruC domain-containing protein
LGFEDMRRDAGYGSDNDFNDAIFYATLNPVTAVNKGVYQQVDKPGDTDGDGATDSFDQYPNDPLRAFNNYYPAQNTFGSLAFEDLWPSKGDYDFNDMVVDYNFNQITNARNEVKEIQSGIRVKAIGASYHNAFAISMNTSPNNVQSITGQRNTNNLFSFQSNKTEAGQSKAVMICFDDAYNMLRYPGSGTGINTVPGNPYATPETVQMDVIFISPVAISAMGTPPYNPFMIINRNRSLEVHLPGLPPTDLADLNVLGTKDDNSDPALSKYYMSDKYLPWAINLPVSFSYPTEKTPVDQAYLMFDSWATSKGVLYQDWYLPKAGYRDNSKIY